MHRRFGQWCLAVALILGAAPPAARAEHGGPGYRIVPDEETPLPLSGRVIIHNSNGVAWGLAELKAARPVLHGDGQRLPLRVVDSFDDMEGHTRPFDGEGYGESIIVLEPRRRLRPGVRYELRLERPPWERDERVLAVWTSAAGPDREPPVWRAAAVRAAAPPPQDAEWEEAWKAVRKLIVPVAPEAAPVLLEVLAEPMDAGPAKRLLLLLEGAVDDELWDGCLSVGLWEEDMSEAHRDTRRPYRLSFAAMDLEGNRSAAPGAPVPILWPPRPLDICPDRVGIPPAGPPGAPPRWTGAPRLTFPRRRQPRDAILHLDLPLAPSAGALAVIAETRATPGDRRGRRFVAFLPPARSDVGPCDYLFREDGLPGTELALTVGGRHELRLTALDLDAQRAEAPAPVVVPWTHEAIEVCRVPTEPPPAPAAAPPPPSVWRGAPRVLPGEGPPRVSVALDGAAPLYVAIDARPVRGRGRRAPLYAVLDPLQRGNLGCVRAVALDGAVVLGAPTVPWSLAIVAHDAHGNAAPAPGGPLAVPWNGRDLFVCPEPAP